MKRVLMQLAVSLLLIALPASARQILVGSCAGAAATTIQGGVDLAVAGDRVLVCPGTYAGGILVGTASISIVANGPKGTVMVAGSGASGPQFGFDVFANRVTISGFDISGFSGAPNSAGIFVGGLQVGDTAHHANGAVITNNVLHANGDGIYLWQSNGNTIQNNEIYGSIDIDGTGGIGIQSISGLNDAQVTDANVSDHSGTNNNISLNVIHDNDRMAIYAGAYASSVLADIARTVIGRNQIYGNGGDASTGGAYPSEALSVQFAEEGTISANNIHDNPLAGIFVNFTSGIEVLNNISSITGQVGIFVFSSDQVDVQRNQTNSNALYGIALIASASGVAENNSARGNASFDLIWDTSGTFAFSENSCGTASPSKAVWHCR